MADEGYQVKRKGGIGTANGRVIPDDEMMDRIRELEEENARLDHKRPWYSWLWPWKQ